MLDEDPLKLASPLYCAVMECVPEASAVVENLATPLLTAIAFEMGVVPSKNTTVPVAEPGVTAAVKAAGEPAFTLSSGAVSTNVVCAFCTV